MKKLLIANRGEIAVRIARAAAEAGVASVAIYAEEDAESLHRRCADRAVRLTGAGAAAYLDGEQIVSLALAEGCDAVHPGYGFLSENADFAARLEASGVTFVGPTPAVLAALGDKAKARTLAADCGIPVLRGSAGSLTLAEAHAFFHQLQGAAMIIKAVAGGGGRGLRVVRDAGALDEAFARCASEAKAAFGDGALYAEEYLPQARHVEVQVLGDGQGAISHLWERECSIQRRRQKIVEMAPCPNLADDLRAALTVAALKLAAAVDYRSAGTVEFLVQGARFAFIEANARLQVEHPVTEAVTGVDLVRAQLDIARGKTLRKLGLTQDSIPAPRGFAIEARINMETLAADGQVRPSAGALRVFEPPGGPGVRFDTFATTGYTASPAFDSLLAKLIVHSPDGGFTDAVDKTFRALGETRIEGRRHQPRLPAQAVFGRRISQRRGPYQLHRRTVGGLRRRTGRRSWSGAGAGGGQGGCGGSFGGAGSRQIRRGPEPRRARRTRLAAGTNACRGRRRGRAHAGHRRQLLRGAGRPGLGGVAKCWSWRP